MKLDLVIILIHGIYRVSCVERFFNEGEENVSNRIKRLDVKDGEFTNRIVFTTTGEDDPILWFNQKYPQYDYIGQFWIGNTRYITAQIRQTKTKEVLSTLREDSDVELLRQSSEISWVRQEKAYVRKAKTMDTEWPNLWHLNGDISPTLKVDEAWRAGYSGQGIIIAVLDDGLQTDHPDLAANVDTVNDINIYQGNDNPEPAAGNSHGTQVSGLIGAVKDNNLCIVGVAFNCTLIGVRILGAFAITDAEEAQALSHYLSHVDIYSNSWGPTDGTGFVGPGTITKAAFQEGVTNGRNGKGSIYIWSAGNGNTNDNCNGDGYVNSIYTIAISSVQIGQNAWYSEVCAPALAVTYGGSEDDRFLTTTTTLSDCKSDGVQGTSFAAPIASGIVALTLEANPDLTWRDIQHLIVFTSKRSGFNDTYSNWTMNGANREFSQVMGFGLMDAEAMVSYGKTWTTVPTQQTCNSSTSSPALSTTTSASDSIIVTSGDCSSIHYLEHVVADITFSYTNFRGVAQLFLVSPSGTRSHLLHHRQQDAVDNVAAGSLTWDFMSVHFWKENPIGSWTLEISQKSALATVTLDSWSLKFYGTSTDPWTIVEQTTSPTAADETTHLDVTTKNVLTTEVSTEPITQRTTTVQTTKITTESTTSTPDITTTEVTTESTTTSTPNKPTTEVTTESTTSTPNIPTTEVTTEPTTTSTPNKPTTEVTTESTTSTPNIPTTEVTTESTTSTPNIPTTEVTTEPTTTSTPNIPTTEVTTEPTTTSSPNIPTTEVKTESTTSTPNKPTTEVTTESTTSTPNIPTTEVKTESTTSTPNIPTTEVTTESTTSTPNIPTTEVTTEPTTTSTPNIPTTEVTTESTTSTPNIPTTEVTTESTKTNTPNLPTTEVTTESTTMLSTMKLTTESTTPIITTTANNDITTESTTLNALTIPTMEATTKYTTQNAPTMPPMEVTTESSARITSTMSSLDVTTESTTPITSLKPTQHSSTKEQTTEATTKDSVTESLPLPPSNEDATGTKSTLNNINTPIIAGSIGALVAVLSLIGAIYATCAAKQSISKPDIKTQQTSQTSDMYDSRPFPSVTPRYGKRISWY